MESENVYSLSLLVDKADKGVVRSLCTFKTLTELYVNSREDITRTYIIDVYQWGKDDRNSGLVRTNNGNSISKKQKRIEEYSVGVGLQKV